MRSKSSADFRRNHADPYRDPDADISGYDGKGSFKFLHQYKLDGSVSIVGVELSKNSDESVGGVASTLSLHMTWPHETA